jgi:hypothetical protein
VKKEKCFIVYDRVIQKSNLFIQQFALFVLEFALLVLQNEALSDSLLYTKFVVALLMPLLTII